MNWIELIFKIYCTEAGLLSLIRNLFIFIFLLLSVFIFEYYACIYSKNVQHFVCVCVNSVKCNVIHVNNHSCKNTLLRCEENDLTGYCFFTNTVSRKASQTAQRQPDGLQQQITSSSSPVSQGYTVVCVHVHVIKNLWQSSTFPYFEKVSTVDRHHL